MEVAESVSGEGHWRSSISGDPPESLGLSLFSEKTFTASTSLIFRQKLGTPIESESEKSLMLLLDFQK